MASPYQYPWVDFFEQPTTSIDSTPLLICGAVATTLIDSIFVCNTSDQDIFIDVTLLVERNLVVSNPSRTRHFLLPKYGNADLISATQSTQSPPSELTLEYGDLIYANSDFSGNTFDCLVSGRVLLETAPLSFVTFLKSPERNFKMNPKNLVLPRR